MTKSHKVIHVRDMRLTDEVQEPEEPLAAEQPLVPEQHLVLEEPVVHYGGGNRGSVIERKENATPSHKSIQEEKNH